jgi:hypothetical protein
MGDENLDKDVVAFRCKSCGIVLDVGRCGKHRVETGHKDFEGVYDIEKSEEV